MNEKKIKEAVNAFIKNSAWKSYYEDAPSKVCKRYVELDFYRSHDYSALYPDSAELKAVRAEQKKLQERMSLADWKHLAKYTGNNPFRAKCMEKIKALSGK